MAHPLFDAVVRGDVAAVRTLAASSVGTPLVDEFGRPPLSVACARAGEVSLDVVQALLDAGADLHAVQGKASDEEAGWTALHQACLRGTFPSAIEVVRLLLERGANPRGSGSDGGFTPLYFALTTHHLGIAEALLKAGASASAPLKTGTPLHHVAALFRDRKKGEYEEDELESMATDAVQLLLAHGADVQARDAQGESPLAKALLYRLPAEAILALLKAGAPLDDRVDLGTPPEVLRCSTPAMAIGLGQPPAVLAAMLERGLDTSPSTEPEGQNLLHFAAMKRFDAVDLILNSRPKQDVDARDESGATALFLAAWTGKLKSVEALLARGANPDLPDSGGNTPLHTAARNGHDDVVAALLAGGANPRLLNQAKESPADRARKQGHAALAAKLS
ncbi:ankyrin repeat domain-containing protein [Myxococcaceae bacterium JPH2]|nr:ankyrin repeat domain-containing protein [Myxococcaceae bacterium JPH2]